MRQSRTTCRSPGRRPGIPLVCPLLCAVLLAGLLLALQAAAAGAAGSAAAARPLQTRARPSLTHAGAVTTTSLYTVQDLGTLSGSSTYARAVNISGTVAGWSLLAPGALERAFVWQDGQIAALSVLGGSSPRSYAYGINASGQIVGASTSGASESRAVRWTGGIPSDLGTVGGRRAVALHINDAGQAVGWSEFSYDSQETLAVRWPGGVLPAPGNLNAAWSINEAAAAVGESCTATATDTTCRPYAWPGGALATLGGTGGSARDIDEAGRIVGWSGSTQHDHHGDAIPHATLWVEGAPTDLGVLPGQKVSRANAIGASGDIVGAASIGGEQASSPTHAVLWRDGQIYDLNDLLPPGSGWVLIEAYGINDAGQIVGIGGHDGIYYRGFLLTPATRPIVTLAGPGLGLIGETYAFTATIGPDTIDQPITYTWSFSPTAALLPTLGGLTDSATFAWAHGGQHMVTVVVTSALGASALAVHEIDIGDALVRPAAGVTTTITHGYSLTGGVTITVPAGTVPAGTELLFTALDRPAASQAFSFAGIAFTLDAYVGGVRQPGFLFDRPVTVTITYDDDDIVGLDESAIRLYYQLGTAWFDAAATCSPRSVYDRRPLTNTLSLRVCHLSKFAAWQYDPWLGYLPMARK